MNAILFFKNIKKMTLNVYLIFFLTCLTVHGKVIKPVIINEKIMEDKLPFVNSKANLVLSRNSPFFYHAQHQNSGFRNRPTVQIAHAGIRSAVSARSGQSQTCSADILCDASTTQVNFI